MTPPGSRRGGGLVRAEELSPRDLAVLQDLARVRLLTGRHVQRLHLHEGSPLTQSRRTRSLLQRLTALGLVSRLERRIGGVHAGSAGFVYGLSARGQRLISGVGPAGGRRLRRPWEPSRFFVEHVLGVSELYVDLREAEAARQHELLSFDAEPAAWRFWSGPAGERQVLKPDAFVVTAVGDLEYRHFVEVDRDTESRTVLRRKALIYVSYWRVGSEQQRTGIFPQVLFVVPSLKRLEQLVDVVAQLEPEVWALFRVVRSEEASAVFSGRPPPLAA